METLSHVKRSCICSFSHSGIICLVETYDGRSYTYYPLRKDGKKDLRYIPWSGAWDERAQILHKMIPSTIAVDFDDTLCKDGCLGEVCDGEVVEWVKSLLLDLKLRGWLIILWTCRENKNLTAARVFCEENGVPIDFYNENPIGVTFFTELTGEALDHPPAKVWADIYLDDAAVSSYHPFAPQDQPIDSANVDIRKLADLYDEWAEIRRWRWTHFTRLCDLATLMKQEVTTVSTQTK